MISGQLQNYCILFKLKMAVFTKKRRLIDVQVQTTINPELCAEKRTKDLISMIAGNTSPTVRCQRMQNFEQLL